MTFTTSTGHDWKLDPRQALHPELMCDYTKIAGSARLRASETRWTVAVGSTGAFGEGRSLKDCQRKAEIAAAKLLLPRLLHGVISPVLPEK